VGQNGFMTTAARVHLSKTRPTAYEKLAAFAKEVGKLARDAGIEPLLCELVQMRASQINGCAYCLRVHTKKALSLGETAERMTVLSAWREAGLYSERERAALALTEAITLVSNGHVSDEVYAASREIFDEEEFATLSWMIVSINAFNRIAVTSRYLVDPEES
jgi:AhpD family alkylhydroperoxidase